MKTLVLSASLAFALVSATGADATDYSCTFSGRDVGRLVSETVLVRHDETDGSVQVMDGIINNYVGSPVAGVLKSRNATRVLFSWSVPSLKDTKGQWIPGFTFSLNIIRATGAATINSYPSGNYKSGRASGACTTK